MRWVESHASVKGLPQARRRLSTDPRLTRTRSARQTFSFLTGPSRDLPMMAIANDIGWESIFVEPLKNFLSPNDLVIGISGSGNSKNVVNAIEYANEQGATTVAMSGFKGGKISQIATIDVHAPVMDMEVTEDVHMVIFNIVKKQMMARLMGDNPSMGDTYDQRVG